MPIGDEERRKKSKRHREAAYSRWESRGERTARRTGERIVDGLDWLYRAVLWVVLIPWWALRFLAGDTPSRSRSRDRDDRSWRR